jgi:hypothetical protein
MKLKSCPGQGTGQPWTRPRTTLDKAWDNPGQGPGQLQTRARTTQDKAWDNPGQGSGQPQTRLRTTPDKQLAILVQCCVEVFFWLTKLPSGARIWWEFDDNMFSEHMSNMAIDHMPIIFKICSIYVSWSKGWSYADHILITFKISSIIWSPGLCLPYFQ